MEHLPESRDEHKVQEWRDLPQEDIEMRITLLEKAKALISHPGSWTIGALARSFWKKKVVHYSSNEADQWCVLGAIRKVVYDSLGTNVRSICVCTDVIHSMEKATGSEYLPLHRYNDMPPFSHDKIMSLFDKAITNEAHELNKGEGG